MPDYTDEQLSKMTQAETTALRNLPNLTQEQKDRYANYDHRAFAREVVKEDKGMIAALPAAIPAYYAAKKAGVVDNPSTDPNGNTSNASLEQVKQAAIGYVEGVGDLVNENITKPLMRPWEKVYQKATEVVKDIAKQTSGSMPWEKTWQKEDVSVAPKPKHTIDTIMPNLIQAESRGVHADAKGKLTTSPAGAEGITQLRPSTAKNPGYGIKPAQDKSEGEYLRVGKEYLQKMYDKFGSWEQALAAYNAGVGNVTKAISKAERYGGDWKEHLPKKEETIPYIKKILGKE